MNSYYRDESSAKRTIFFFSLFVFSVRVRLLARRERCHKPHIVPTIRCLIWCEFFESNKTETELMIFVDDFLLGKYTIFFTLHALAGLRYISFERIDTFQCLWIALNTIFRKYFRFREERVLTYFVLSQQIIFCAHKFYFRIIERLWRKCPIKKDTRRTMWRMNWCCESGTGGAMNTGLAQTARRIRNLFLFFDELFREQRHAGEILSQALSA